MKWTRSNPIFFERDHSFNPFWFLIGVLVGVAAYAIVRAFNTGSSVVQIAALSFLAVTLNVFVMAAVNQNKAQIIANASSTGAIASGLTSGTLHCVPEPAPDPTDHPDRA